MLDAINGLVGKINAWFNRLLSSVISSVETENSVWSEFSKSALIVLSSSERLEGARVN